MRLHWSKSWVALATLITWPLVSCQCVWIVLLNFLNIDSNKRFGFHRNREKKNLLAIRWDQLRKKIEIRIQRFNGDTNSLFLSQMWCQDIYPFTISQSVHSTVLCPSHCIYSYGKTINFLIMFTELQSFNMTIVRLQ